MKKTLTLFVFTFFVLTGWSQDHIVGVTNNVYTPADITITVGETIEWQNTEGFHNVNGTQTTYPDNPESFGNMTGTGWTFQHTFNTAGTYDYQCDPHVSFGMIGTITVNPAASTDEIVITEIMYNPPESGVDSTEYIEILNNGPDTVNMENYSFGGVDFTFPAMLVQPGEYVVVTSNANAFQSYYGTCLLYTSPSPRDRTRSRMPSSA